MNNIDYFGMLQDAVDKIRNEYQNNINVFKGMQQETLEMIGEGNAIAELSEKLRMLDKESILMHSRIQKCVDDNVSVKFMLKMVDNGLNEFSGQLYPDNYYQEQRIAMNIAYHMLTQLGEKEAQAYLLEKRMTNYLVQSSDMIKNQINAYGYTGDFVTSRLDFSNNGYIKFVWAVELKDRMHYIEKIVMVLEEFNDSYQMSVSRYSNKDNNGMEYKDIERTSAKQSREQMEILAPVLHKVVRDMAQSMGLVEPLSYKVQTLIEADFTLDILADILSTAFEGGVNSWVSKVNYSEPRAGKDRSKFSSRYMISHGIEDYYGHMSPLVGGFIEVNTYDEPEVTHVLTLQKLIAGLALYLNDERTEGTHMRNITDLESWIGNVDANEASAIIELALFGEVRYC